MEKQLDIDATIMRELIAEQFPDWAGLRITPVGRQGWDNRTFRLGEHLSVRLPSAVRYVAQVEKEQKWLPVLAPHLSLPIPVPRAKGVPSAIYPFSWSVMEWLEGEPASWRQRIDFFRFASAAAAFLRSLRQADAADGPRAGPHNFFRGGDLKIYDGQTRGALETLKHQLDHDAALALWNDALASCWQGESVWVHGDFAPDNLLVSDGELGAVIDFGGLGVGDPACDLVLAWTFFPDDCRDEFKKCVALDASTWVRARGWALWKAMLILTGQSGQKQSERPAQEVIDIVLREHRG